MPDLFSPVRAGAVELSHRIVLAPLTRQRAAEPSLAPREMNVEYYAQRATPGGLLVSEATHISAETHGYVHAPHIWTDEHIAGWRRVTDAVHAKGGRFFCQLWHIGRVAHPNGGEHPIARLVGRDGRGVPQPSVSASDVAMKGKASTYKGRVPNAAPRPLRADEIPRLVDDYRHAARCALAAGFDGVEVHAAHGYLIDQFLCDGTNKRTDAYGGSIPNRCRLLFDVVGALCAIAPGRVAVRLSPTTPESRGYFMCKDSDPFPLYDHAVAGLNQFPMAYLLLSEPRWMGVHDGNPDKDPGFSQPLVNGPRYRKLYNGVLMGAGGFSPASAAVAVADGTYDLVAFGRWFIANPDLPARIRSGGDLNVYNRDTFYSYEAEGYTDYPPASLSVAGGKYRLIPQSAIGATLEETLRKAKL